MSVGPGPPHLRVGVASFSLNSPGADAPSLVVERARLHGWIISKCVLGTAMGTGSTHFGAPGNGPQATRGLVIHAVRHYHRLTFGATRSSPSLSEQSLLFVGKRGLYRVQSSQHHLLDALGA